MNLLNLFNHEFLVAVSSVACIAGLLLLWGTKPGQDDIEETEQILLRMSFTYWLVYCVAFGIDKIALPEWEAIQMTLKITTALAYFLTFSCILSLPLHRFAVRQVEE
jgi:peptidoglycan biosynthesis protein MviN/MurJ (putative lipid II flippase)